MAKCEVNEIPPVKPVKEFVLTLNEEEAKLIYAMMGNISGGGRYRQTTSDIYYALGEHFETNGSEIVHNLFKDQVFAMTHYDGDI